MSNENLDETRVIAKPAGSQDGELSDAVLESVAGGIIFVVGRTVPVPNDGRSIAGTPVPDDGHGILGEPVPDDNKLSKG